MRYFSTFTGIGGFELGIQQAYESLCNADGSEVGGGKKDSQGDERQRLLTSEREDTCSPERPTGECASNLTHKRPLCVGYSEIDKYAVQIYEKHFPNHKNYGDITKINARDLPDFDFLVGGFPFQTFSIAGKRMGFEEARGTLFFEIARIVKEKQPRLLLLENVKGLLSHNKGRTFRTIIVTLDELGYDCQWQVLNSKDHGVPQNRERVYIAGHLRGTPRPEVFPIEKSNSKNNLNKYENNTNNTNSVNSYRTYKTNNTNIFSSGIKQINQPKHSNDRVDSVVGISPTLNTMQGGMRQPFIKLTKGMQIRRLTPLECERLQGFPDNWTGGISDTQRYKCCGNAVTVNVIKDICEKLL